MATAALTAALLTAGCPNAGIRVLGPGIGGGAGGGGGGAGGSGASLVGVWRNLFSTTSASETIITDTRWTFGAGGDCSRTVVKTFVVAGVETTDVRNCQYTTAGSNVTIIFEGSSVPTTFSVAFSSGDLLLGGFRFQRIG